MPVITFETPKLNQQQKQSLIAEFTASAARITGLPDKSFYVFIKENDLDNVGVGGEMLSQMKK